MSRSVILLVLVMGCSSTRESPRPPKETGSGDAPKPVPADAVTCETDKDCDRHACGPCNAGDVLTKHDVTIKCVVNPCPRTTVSCKNKVCTVDAPTASVDASVPIPDLPKLATDVPTKPDALQTWLIAGHYKAWSHESRDHLSEGPHDTARVFVSPVLQKSLGDKATEHPIGASAVKELYKDGKHSGWAVSVKLAAPSNEGKNWYWYEIFSTQPNAKAPYQGVGFRLCRDCHFEGGGVDLVRSTYPLQ